MTVVRVSQRQENKEDPSCQCDPDLENPEKGKSWLLAAGERLGSLGVVSSCCEFLIYRLTKVRGMESGEMAGSLLLLCLAPRRHIH